MQQGFSVKSLWNNTTHILKSGPCWFRIYVTYIKSVPLTCDNYISYIRHTHLWYILDLQSMAQRRSTMSGNPYPMTKTTAKTNTKTIICLRLQFIQTVSLRVKKPTFWQDCKLTNIKTVLAPENCHYCSVHVPLSDINIEIKQT